MAECFPAELNPFFSPRTRQLGTWEACRNIGKEASRPTSFRHHQSLYCCIWPSVSSCPSVTMSITGMESISIFLRREWDIVSSNRVGGTAAHQRKPAEKDE